MKWTTWKSKWSKSEAINRESVNLNHNFQADKYHVDLGEHSEGNSKIDINKFLLLLWIFNNWIKKDKAIDEYFSTWVSCRGRRSRNRDQPHCNLGKTCWNMSCLLLIHCISCSFQRAHRKKFHKLHDGTPFPMAASVE